MIRGEQFHFLRLGPHGEFVAVGVGEMEAVAAGELKNRFDDFATGGFDGVRNVRQLVAIENHQGAAQRHRSVRVKPALHMAVREFAIVRSIVREGSAEGPSVEILRALDVGDSEFDVIDAAGWIIPVHLSAPRRSAPCRAGAGGGSAARAFYGARAGIEAPRLNGVGDFAGVGLAFFDFLRCFCLCPFAGPGFGHGYFAFPKEKTESHPARYCGVERLEK